MTDPMMKYGSGAILDAVHSTAQFSTQLDQIAHEALNLLAGSQEFFDTQQGSGAYQHAQQLIIQAIDHGKDVINNHGTTAEAALSNFTSMDSAAAQSFGA